MSIEYTFDILAKLKEAGYSTYKLRKDKILGEATIQKRRTGIMGKYIYNLRIA